uniref:D730039F16Rik protein n=1 Tax=Mus musculus TaxID=10090 RepID=Q8VC61_MOUSE|nr:D730039F16Rik protein [Mus musculus]
MDRPESRCPPPGSLRLVLTCLLILTAVLMYPVLRTFSLWLHSSLTGIYVSGSYSIVLSTVPMSKLPETSPGPSWIRRWLRL